jgi:hypothetical protein
MGSERGLPKWPQMLTSGMPVSIDQAREIIRRTDGFFRRGCGGNDHAFNQDLARRLRMPEDLAEPPPSWTWDDYFGKRDRWREFWGFIDTEYVSNNWISSAYILGPHGWCWPDGRISYEDNVGKWPSVDDVARDWAEIAQAFPFLDLAATLMSGEHCQDGIVPVATIVVRDGGATALDGSLEHHARFPAPHRRTDDEEDSAYLLRHRSGVDLLRSEHGPIPESWFDEWEATAARIFPGARSR